MAINPNMRCQLLEVEGSFNVRDLGGYPTREGKTIRHRRFLRAGSLSGLTGQGVAALGEAGVECIVDLRSRREVELQPDALPQDAFAWHHVPMLDHIQSNLAGKIETFPETMAAMYREMVDLGGAGFARVFTLFADSRYQSYLFHCTAGKDRTGVTAMLLLALAGVADDDIVEDYSWSEQLVPLFPGAAAARVPSEFLTSRPETMRGVLEHIRSRYGGPEEYLAQIGVTAGQMEAVRCKLLD